MTTFAAGLRVVPLGSRFRGVQAAVQGRPLSVGEESEMERFEERIGSLIRS